MPRTSQFGVGQLAADLRHDARFGLRLLVRSPGFAVVTVATLAIAIGANAAIFAVVDALLLRPLPVTAPDALVRIYAGQSRVSWPNYQDIRDRSDVFDGVAARRTFFGGLTLADVPERLTGEQTSTNYFSVIGASAAVGRIYTEADSRRDLIVLADHVWRTRFGADPGVVGRMVRLEARSYEVIGVMPPKFHGITAPGMSRDFWMVVEEGAPALNDRNVPFVEVIARLKPGVRPAQATAAMAVLAQRLRSEYPTLPESFLQMEVFSVGGINAFRGLAGSFLPIFAFLGLLTIVSGFVLLIGCANVAGLLIGQAIGRHREIATRLALGAKRGRLVRQLLTESLVLALLGGIAGVLLSVWLTGGVDLLASRLPTPLQFDLQIDRLVLVYALGLSTVTAVIFGLMPARAASRFDLVSSLRAADGPRGGQRLRRALVVGQIVVCSAVLLWSGQFLRSLGRISDVDPGFDPSGVVLAHVTLSEDPRDRARGEQAIVEWQRRVVEAPRVSSAGASLVVPLALASNEEYYVGPEGAETTQRVRVYANRLTPGWFETIRLPFVLGRDFTWDDRDESPGVVIVNETLARRFWNGDGLGKRISVPVPGNVRRLVEVVGIVRDSKYWTLGEAATPAVYLPLRQAYLYDLTLHVRTADVGATSRVVRQELNRLAPGVPVEIKPMSQVVDAAVMPAWIGASLTLAFGIVAMLLSTLGLYGLVSYGVSQRMREISIRKALGASSGDIVRLIVGGSARWTFLSLVVGLVAGAFAAQALTRFIVGVSPTDPPTLIMVTIVVMLTALGASVVPAARAVRADPLAMLRDN